MPRQSSNQAQSTYNQAGETAGAGTSIATTAGNNANTLYNQLFPTYQEEAAGLPTAGTTAETTAAEQSLGGSTGGALSEGDLTAARTRNSGSFQPEEDQAVREGGQDLSDASTAIKANEVQQGQQGEENLYKENEGQQIAGEGINLGALGAENSATNANTSASPGWFQNFTSLLNALKPSGGGGGGGSSGGGSYSGGPSIG